VAEAAEEALSSTWSAGIPDFNEAAAVKPRKREYYDLAPRLIAGMQVVGSRELVGTRY
jgi:hypothetical protein